MRIRRSKSRADELRWQPRDTLETHLAVREQRDHRTYAVVEKMFKTPAVEVPDEFKAWLKAYIESSGLELPKTAIVGLDAAAPIGAVYMWGGTTAPADHLLLNGQAISRNTYAALFAIYGTRYGAGDGSTTFNLPDCRQRFPLGLATSGTGNALGDTGGAIDHRHTGPSHAHSMPDHAHTVNINTGDAAGAAFNAAADVNPVPVFQHQHNVNGNTGLSGSGNTGAAGTGNTGTANPPFIVFNFIIKAL